MFLKLAFLVNFFLLYSAKFSLVNAQWDNSSTNATSTRMVIYPNYDPVYPGQLCLMYLRPIDSSTSESPISYIKNDENVIRLSFIQPFYEKDKDKPFFEYKYFRKDDAELYKLINDEKMIRYAYIEELDLNKLVNYSRSKEGSLVIDKKITISFCIINKIITPHAFESNFDFFFPFQKELTEADSLYFERPFGIFNCSLRSTLTFQNTVFRDTFYFSNIYADVNSTARVIEVSRSRFCKDVFLNDYQVSAEGDVENRDSLLLSLKNWKHEQGYKEIFHSGIFRFVYNTFEGNCHIYNGTEQYLFNLDENTFLKQANFCRYTNPNEDFNRFGYTPDLRYEVPLINSGSYVGSRVWALNHKASKLYNISAAHCSFRTFNLENVTVTNCSFAYSRINDTIILYNTSADSSSNLATISINSENPVCFIAGLDTNWLKLKLPSSTYDQFYFGFIYNNNVNTYSLIEKQKIKDYYNLLKIIITDRFKDNPEQMQELKDRLKFDFDKYCHFYYKKNNMYREYVWSSFLWGTVNFGYHGEVNFFLVTGVIILLFSLLYFLRFRKDVVRYLTMISYKTMGKQRYSSGISFRTFLRCTWVSFMIFVNPKLPLIYFQIRRPLFTYFMIEWFIGTVLMTVFIFYIVSKYPLIRMIFG